MRHENETALCADAELDGIALLEGIPSQKRSAVMKCLNARIQHLEEGRPIGSLRDSPDRIHYLMQGSLRLERLDEKGNRSILTLHYPGTVVGRSLTPQLYQDEEMTLSSNEPSTFLSFSIQPTVESCSCCIKHVNTVRSNLIRSLSTMNSQLVSRAGTLSCRSTRERVLHFLHAQADLQKSRRFEIAYNRQELADLLCVERSALSRELGRLRDEGLISYERNRFCLL